MGHSLLLGGRERKSSERARHYDEATPAQVAVEFRTAILCIGLGTGTRFAQFADAGPDRS